MMDRRLRRAPDPEWVLMYRLGLSRKRISELVRVHPATAGYHLVIARRRDPGLEAGHHTAAGAAPVPYPSPKSLARMQEITAWISAGGRLPRGHAEHRDERSRARWLAERRREAAQGILDPAYRADSPRFRSGTETTGQPGTTRDGRTAWPGSWTSGRKATTGPATTTTTQSANTPSACGSTHKGTNTAAANSPRPGPGFWIRPFPAGRPADGGAALSAGDRSGLCPLGAGGALRTAQAVPTGVQPGLCRGRGRRR